MVKQKILYILITAIISGTCLASIITFVGVMNAKTHLLAFAEQHAPEGFLKDGLHRFDSFSTAVLGMQTVNQQNTITQTTSTNTIATPAALPSSVLNGLTVNGSAEIKGGIITDGGNIDLGTGAIKASNILYGLRAGTGTQITDGQWPQINNTGVLSLQGLSGDLNFTAGSGIGVSGLTITNNDAGSGQSIFKNIAVSGQSTLTAGNNNDTLTFAAGSGISLSTATGTKTVTITSTGSSGGGGWTESSGVIIEQTQTDYVGIGTTTPTAQLDVSGAASIAGALKLYSTPTLQSTSEQSLTLGGDTTGNIILMPLNGSGNVGINTSSPTGSLDINNNGTALVLGTGSNTQTLVNVSGNRMMFGYDGNSAVVQAGNNKQIRFNVNNSTFGSGTAMIIDTSGNIGIGTTSPQASLDVSGTASVSGGLKLYSTPTLQSTANQTLVLGGNTTGDIQFKPGNTTSGLYLASSGNVGINTTSPTAPFQIASNGNAFVLGSGSNTQTFVNVSSNRAMFGYDGANAVFQAGTNKAINFNVNNATFGSGTAMTLTSTGNLGINTTSPTAFLDVNGAASVSGQLALYGTATLQSTANKTLALGGDTTGDIQFKPGNTTTGLYLSSSGNVGINTTSPTAPFQIASNGNAFVLGSGSNTQTFVNVSSNRAMFGYDGANAAFQSGTNKAINFNVNNATFGSGTAMTITSTGNVGINTTSPTALLDVNGTASISGQLALYGTPTLQSTANQTLVLGGSTTGDIQFKPGNTTAGLYLSSSGNVGINTSSPAAPFQIASNGNAFVLGSGSNTQTFVNVSSNRAMFGYDGTNAVFQAGTNKGINFNVSNATFGSGTAMTIGANGSVGLGTTLAGNGELVINQPNNTGDILSASSAGTTEFKIDNSGNMTLAGTTTFNGQTYSWPSGGQSNGYVLTTNGSGSLSWTAGSGLGTNNWQENSGAVSPKNISDDLLIGGTATTSATFGLINVAAGTPTATIASNLSLKVPTGTNPATTFNILNGGSLNFQTTSTGQGDAGLTSRLFIKNNGNIGIGGITNPNNALAVQAVTSTSVAALALTTPTNSGADTQFASFDGRAEVGYDGALGAAFLQGVSGKGLELQTNGTSTKLYLGPNISAQIGTQSNSINAALVVNQTNASGNGDIFTASVAGTTKFDITNSGSVVIGNAALATNATDGFLYIPTSAGAPTAAPTTQTGTVALEYDTTNNKLMIYNGGWKGATTPGAFSDFAEWADAPGAASGDIVTITDKKNPTPDTTDPFVLAKATTSYDNKLAGVISQYAEDANSANGYKKSADYHAVALIGRVPVKISSINGSIQAGDYLTSSSIPGVAMKATKAGTMIGKALESYTDTNTQDIGTIMVLVNVSYADPNATQVALTNTGDLSINGQLVGQQTTSTGITNTSINNTSLQQPAANTVTADQFTNLATTVSQLQTQMASQAAQRGKIDDLSKQLAEIEKTTNLNQALAGISTESALPETTTTNENTIIQGKLSVLGKTLLGDVGITGSISDGLLAVNGMDISSGTPSATINTLSVPLKLQSLAAAGLDFENGKVTIDTNGNILTQGSITANVVHADKYQANDTGDGATVGEATIQAGKTTVVIKSTNVTDKSQIFTSPKTLIDVPLVITHQDTGKSFTVEISKPFTKDINFGWWILN